MAVRRTTGDILTPQPTGLFRWIREAVVSILSSLQTDLKSWFPKVIQPLTPSWRTTTPRLWWLTLRNSGSSWVLRTGLCSAAPGAPHSASPTPSITLIGRDRNNLTSCYHRLSLQSPGPHSQGNIHVSPLRTSLFLPERRQSQYVIAASLVSTS